MFFRTIPIADTGVIVQISRYDAVQGVTEWHLIFHVRTVFRASMAA